MTGRIRDIGQSVLLSAFVTGSGSSSTVTAMLCYLPHYLRKAFIRNVIIILYINYNKH